METGRLSTDQVVIPRGEHFVALAIVRSLGKKGIRTAVISEHPNAMALSSKYCNKKIVADNSFKPYESFSENDLIMPTDENLMIELANNRGRYHCSLAFPDHHVLNTAFNKKSVLEHAYESDIPCPVTFFPKDSDDIRNQLHTIDFPAVIKPIRGLSGRGISFVNSADELVNSYEETRKQFDQLMIQEKIPYTERYSVACLMNFEHCMRRFCVLKVIRCYPISTGPATIVESVNRPDLVAMADTLLQSINFSGIAEVEFVIDKRNDTPKLMEINPRFWGSLQGAISAGVDFPSLLYTLFQEGDIDNNNVYRTGVRTRNAIANDFRQLSSVIRGNYPLVSKKSSLIEFLKFYRDDSYYIFNWDDLRPFLSYISDSATRVIKKRMSHNTR
jgi:predicted ATP-grasp superfamily ATP-dependent carboligase